MIKFLANLVVVLVAYTIGLAIGIAMIVGKRIGAVKIFNPENFPKLGTKLAIFGNHSDAWDFMAELFILPALLFPHYLLHPLKLVPWFTPDKHNFTDKWYWAWLRPRAISVERNKGNTAIKEARKMISVLNDFNGVLIHFPEGGRTCTGKNFLVSSKGKKIRVLKPSAGWLILKTQASVFPVWIENGEAPLQPGKRLFSWPNFKRGPIIVRFGKLMKFSEQLSSKSALELTDIIAKNLLNLADQE